MRRTVTAALAAAVCWTGAALAQSQPEALALLQRMYTATQKLNYSGTFIYQHGDHSETSRITRLVDHGTIYERVEILDGMPREIVRANDEVKCYLPDQHDGEGRPQAGRQAVSRHAAGPDSIHRRELQRAQGRERRIAGYDCQSIVLEPKDDLRYGHKLWADVDSGMLLKAQDLQREGRAARAVLLHRSRIGGGSIATRCGRNTRARTARGASRTVAMHEVNLAAAGWLMKPLPPGYSQGHGDAGARSAASPSVGQIVLFGRPGGRFGFHRADERSAAAAPAGLSRKGAINIYTRRVEDSLVTVVGEVPAEGVRFIANQVEYRKPN